MFPFLPFGSFGIREVAHRVNLYSQQIMQIANVNFNTISLLLFAGLSSAVTAYASAQTTDRTPYAVTVYEGQGSDHNLKQLPKAIISGDVKWEKSYFTSVAFSADQGQLGQGISFFQGTPFASVRYGYEAILTKHRGLQNHLEAGAVAKLTTPDLFIGPAGVNFGAGLGLSHAFGTPSYEDGPTNDPTRRYRTQLLILFDLEWRLRGIDNLSLVTRVHHRSGAYGLIAPQNVGSNFLAAGLRYRY